MLNCVNFNYVYKFFGFDLSFLKLDWSEQGNIIRNNVIVSVSGTEGLSNPEMVTPSGIYIRSPTNVVEVRFSPERSELRRHTGHSKSYLKGQHR